MYLPPRNPSDGARGRTGKTPVLEPAEARRLLDSIDVSTPAGLRDKALIRIDGLFIRQSWRRPRHEG